MPCTEKIQTHRNDNLKALLFGLNYSNWKKFQLQNCIHDVAYIKHILKKCGFTEENITTMTDLDVDTPHYPTMVNMLRQLLYWVETINHSQEKVGFLHYSGHGSQVKAKNKDELDDLDEIILPIDYPDPSDPDAKPAPVENSKEVQKILKDLSLDKLLPYIDDNTLFKIISKLHKDSFVVILEDGSHSGTGFDFPFQVLEDGTHIVMNQTFLPDSKSLSNCEKLPTVIKISGTDDHEVASSEGRIEGENAGATTAAFCSTLKKYKYKLTYRQLLSGMKLYLLGNNPEGVIYKQHPQMTSTRPIDLDSYFIKSETVLQKTILKPEESKFKLLFPKSNKEQKSDIPSTL